ncbi:MAG: 30S ribosomal protein S18 [Burkholderiales bacterium]|nr:30S ribosomal protein S18 [Anaerolineae bacterium]
MSNRDNRPDFDDDDVDVDDDDDGGGRGRGRRGGGGFDRRRRRGRNAYYCPPGKCFDYKDVDALRRFTTESGKIKPRRQTGNCSRCQRELAREIKRARHLALLPFEVSADN